MNLIINFTPTGMIPTKDMHISMIAMDLPVKRHTGQKSIVVS
jgi:hypothetical protein